LAFGLLFFGLIIILLGAELFTNGIEWFGHKLKLAEGVVGSILAAVGTALPETLVPLVAILFGSNSGSGHEIGIGAILGAPFMLSTLAFFVTGMAVIIFTKTRGRSGDLEVNTTVVKRDLLFFTVVYIVAISAAFLNVAHYRVVFVVFLLGAYAFYVYRHLQDEGQLGEYLSPLHFARSHPRPRLRIVSLQVLAGLGCIIGGAQVFVQGIHQTSEMVGIPALLLSLLIVPIATELPEKFNSVLWVRQSKDTLAMGNISGAMVFQSCIPTAVGVGMTEWMLDFSSLLSAAIALGSALSVYLFLRFKNRLPASFLLLGGILYLVYLVVVLVKH